MGSNPTGGTFHRYTTEENKNMSYMIAAGYNSFFTMELFGPFTSVDDAQEFLTEKLEDPFMSDAVESMNFRIVQVYSPEALTVRHGMDEYMGD